MTTGSFKALVGICAALAIASANAATVSYSFSNPLEATDISQTGSLALFNTSLGTLTGATLTVKGDLRTQVSLTNDSQANQTIRYSTTSDVGINSSLPQVDQLFNGSSDLSFNLSIGPLNLAPGASYVHPLVLDSKTQTLSLATALSALSAPGGGSFTVSCESLTSQSVSGGGGNVQAQQATDAGCGAELTYTYTPTPPAPVPVGGPAMLGLMGLAMLGLAARLRRKAP